MQCMRGLQADVMHTKVPFTLREWIFCVTFANESCKIALIERACVRVCKRERSREFPWDVHQGHDRN